MRLAKVQLPDSDVRIAVWEENNQLRMLDLTQVDDCRNLSELLHSPDPLGLAKYLIDQQAEPLTPSDVTILPPLDRQEVWAAGVTYKRSQVARMEESKAGASHYDKVYTAPRPELFFKATPNRVSGPHQPLRIRADTEWSVPEPEFALIISPDLRLVAYTIGNDMSARDIEGENPLYLPQAKLYKECCGLGPCVLIPEKKLDRPNTKIELVINRGREDVFKGQTDLGQMARTFEDLISWLGKDNLFPNGVILLTGTGIVPPDDFTLAAGDLVSITITGIGTLTNPIVQG
ncbi:MAG: fumarylacetoacetate hydrolase family protein [Planctomycetales bacterium]